MYIFGLHAVRSVIAHLGSFSRVQVLVRKVADSIRYPKRADVLITLPFWRNQFCIEVDLRHVDCRNPAMRSTWDPQLPVTLPSTAFLVEDGPVLNCPVEYDCRWTPLESSSLNASSICPFTGARTLTTSNLNRIDLRCGNRLFIKTHHSLHVVSL